MKHVTIAPQVREPSPDNITGLGKIALGNGLSLPKVLHLHPGDDGYRTPTIEDYERQPINGDGKEQELGILADNSFHQRIPHPPTTLNGSHRPSLVGYRQSANASLASLGERLLERLQWRERIRHYTWTFFTMTMATGGIANVLYEGMGYYLPLVIGFTLIASAAVPYRFQGLHAIGLIFFFLNILLFVMNVVLISLRFYNHPEMFLASILHPTERLFVPAAVVSFGTILLNISQYGPSLAGHWLDKAVTILYWIDAALAICASMGVYLVMWSTASFTISQMTPLWIFPAYPLLIISPHAGVLARTLPQKKAFDVIVGGWTLQGIGFMVSLMIYSAFIYRLMTQKLPKEASRPAMFVSVGPAGFTVAGILGMAEGVQRALPPGFMGDEILAATIIKVVAAYMSLWIWGLAIWFFFISVGAHWSCVKHGRMMFTMTWFSYVFPNTALITSTFAVGKTFNSSAIQIVGCVLTPVLIVVWFAVFGMMIRALYLKHILWPQKGEDKDEGGFIHPGKRSRALSV